MDSTWIIFAPALVMFGWALGSQQPPGTCPHCGSALPGGVKTAHDHPGVSDPEFAGQVGFDSRRHRRIALILTVVCMVTIPFVAWFATRSLVPPVPPAASPLPAVGPGGG